MKKYQEGFSIVEGLLIVVIVGMLGGVGWYVWHANSQANRTLDDAAKVSQNAPTVTSKTQNKGASKPKNLEISEYKIKVPLSSTIQDAYYLDVKGKSEAQIGSIVFGLHSFDSDKTIPDSCKPSLTKVAYESDGSPVGDGLVELSFDLDNASKRTSAQHSEAKEAKVGNNYFSLDSLCSSNDPAVQSKIKAVQDDFITAGASIVAM
jgi:type II secretory pathway pseudopilin PulG